MGTAITEPDAGSDILSILTLAKKDGDAYVIKRIKTIHHERKYRQLSCRILLGSSRGGIEAQEVWRNHCGDGSSRV